MSSIFFDVVELTDSSPFDLGSIVFVRMLCSTTECSSIPLSSKAISLYLYRRDPQKNPRLQPQANGNHTANVAIFTSHWSTKGIVGYDGTLESWKRNRETSSKDFKESRSSLENYAKMMGIMETWIKLRSLDYPSLLHS